MKRCPRCNRIYSEDDLNFCLDDGELLQQYSDEQPTRPLNQSDPPPTIMMDSPRVTNPIGWDAGQNIGQPLGQWQGNQPHTVPQTQFAGYPMTRSPNQTLAVVSLALGVGALTIGWCCYVGTALGPAAIVTGIIALVQIKNHPQLYTGRSFAIVGIVAGALYFAALFLIFIAAILSNAFQ